MKIQNSFKAAVESTKGSLYLVGTPIGNLEDMTFRAIRILQEVDWIAAEDTRQTRKLLTHFEISTRLVSYHEHNKHSSGPEIIDKLLRGESVALVSDAGLPAISDPGYELVRQAVEQHIHAVPIPGANAALSALMISGLDSSRFIFVGFLPRDKKRMVSNLEQLKSREETFVLYESPHRITKTLQLLLETWGDRRISLAREMTKKYEEILRGTISECIEWFKKNPPKGEFCMVVAGGNEQAEEKNKLWWSLLSIREHMSAYEQQGIIRNEAMKKVAVDRNVSRKEIYNALI